LDRMLRTTNSASRSSYLGRLAPSLVGLVFVEHAAVGHARDRAVVAELAVWVVASVLAVEVATADLAVLLEVLLVGLLVFVVGEFHESCQRVFICLGFATSAVVVAEIRREALVMRNRAESTDWLVAVAAVTQWWWPTGERSKNRPSVGSVMLWHKAQGAQPQ
jgi:hypothetical protein